MKQKRATKTELSVILDVSPTTLSKHLRRKDAPRPDRQGTYDVETVRKFIEGRRSLTNDAGGQTKELVAMRIRKISAEIRRLDQKTQQAPDAVPLQQVAPWLGHFLWAFGTHLPSRFRPGPLMQLLAVEHTPVAMMQVLEAWSHSTTMSLVNWLREHKVEVEVSGERHSIAAPVTNLFSNAAAVPVTSGTANLSDMADAIREFQNALRAAGVTETQLQNAAKNLETSNTPVNPAEKDSAT